MGRPARILVPVALVATLTAASAGKGLASGDLWWSFLNLLLNIAAAAYVGVAILHRDVRRAAFPILMAALLAAMILRLPQLQELYFGLVDDCAQWLAGTKDRSFLRGPLLGLGALALAGLVLGVLARLMLRVRGTDQTSRPWQPRWTLAAALTLFYPWIAAILPLAAAAAVIGGYDSHHGVTYADAAARKLALTASYGLMLAAGACCGALLAAMAALDFGVVHRRHRSRAFPARLRPLRALHNTVRGWLLGFTVLFWSILLLIGVIATWGAGAWAVVALYAGLAALSGGVYVWWASPRRPRWWAAAAGAGWVGLLAAYFALLLSGWRIPERGAGWLTFGYAGACLLALAWRARRGGAGWAWLAVTAVACAWGLLSGIAGLQSATTLDPAPLAVLSSATMLALAWVSLATVGTLVSFWVARDARMRGGVVVSLLLLWTALLAGVSLNENHPVWTLGDGGPDPRPSLERHLHDWLTARAASGRGDSPATAIPLVVAAAHGGGLRAAYWTAAALEQIEAERPGFHRSLFAIASVSGGSIGALLWRTAVTELPGSDDHAARAAWISQGLGQDFLAGFIGGLVVADVPQRFVPDLNARFAVGAAGELPDRHRVLEAAWLRSSPELLSDGADTRDFLHVVTPGGTEAPALFMVATDGDTGRRWIASDVCVDAELFKDAVDTLSQTRRRRPKEDEHGVGPECPVTPESERPPLLRLPAITAAGLSARFPWVSPRGRMPNGSGLLDGGLFESTGAETAAEILRAVNSWCEPSNLAGVVTCYLWPDGTVHKRRDDKEQARAPVPVYVRLLALQLVNDPIEGPDTSPKPGLRLALPELLGPVLALNSSLSARGVAAWASLEGDHALFAGADGPEERLTARVEVAREHTTGGVPLTWTLSEGSRERMTGRLECVVGKRCAQELGKDEEADRLRDWIDRWFPKAPAAGVSASDNGSG